MIDIDKAVNPEWVVVSKERIPFDKFGKDHWSVFAYIETRVVDYHGQLEHDHLRANISRHPYLAIAGYRRSVMGPTNGEKYPTRLKGVKNESGTYETVQLFDHDDYDCIDDLVGAGLITITMPRVFKKGTYVDGEGKEIRVEELISRERRVPTGGKLLQATLLSAMQEGELSQWATFSLTEEGLRIAGLLRAFKATGGNYQQFSPKDIRTEEKELEIG